MVLVEHLDAGVVALEQVGEERVSPDRPRDRLEPVRPRGHPVTEGGGLQVHAAARVDPGEPVERQVVLVLGDQHVREQPRPRQPAVDGLRRRRRDHHALAALAARALRPRVLDHLEARRHELEHLAPLVPDTRLLAAAGGADLLLRRRLEDDLLARQMRRQRLPPVPLARLRLRRRDRSLGAGRRRLQDRLHRRVDLLRLGLRLGEEEGELVRVDLLGALAELVLP